MSASIGLSDAVIDYLRAHNGREHPVLAKCRAEAERVRTTMQISPEQGAFMAFLLRMLNAKRVVEVGVYTGYSSIVMALALKDMHGAGAHLRALDSSEEWTAKARAYWREAGVDDVITLELGDAAARLEARLKAGEGPKSATARRSPAEERQRACACARASPALRRRRGASSRRTAS